ncbi:mitochondrial ATP-independent inner membrane protease subunit 1a-like [Malania oleifera]|uniref:mitochondrial ATP-independent inner membrane protease subunit 1a-like n=1 Tax=Malania oleifera TaxID=397392 RepID=UPI0025AE70B5|nr:mitochondrial ATP-independent inner membrane protease subunit 1a-like [Malania oleifera]XP_057949764.1 mitochondrial ATP-independent inner membrane protease subunit 1a-like [Malania oleifera]
MALRNLKQWKSIAKEAVDQTLTVAKFLCFLHVTNTYLCTTALAYGPSMLPTLNLTGDVILAERISTRFRKVAPGDIVLVRSHENPRKIVAKRLMGMEGDRVTFVVDPKNSDRLDTVVVPKGHIWIEGDNIYDSNDSRRFGAIPYGLLQGKVFWRIWPPKSFGSLCQKSQ